MDELLTFAHVDCFNVQNNALRVQQMYHDAWEAVSQQEHKLGVHRRAVVATSEGSVPSEVSLCVEGSKRALALT